MRLLLLPLFLLIMSVSDIAAQDDFANLARYHAANQERLAHLDKTVLIGNSITDGWYARDTAFFDNNNLIGRGISGQTSVQLLLRFRPDVVDLKPTKVVIHIGTNDVAENTGPYNEEYTVGNIASMVDIALQNNIEVIIASVLPADKFGWRPALGDRSSMIVELNARLKALAEEKGVAFLVYHSALKNARNGMDADLASDGVHPTDKGFAIMAELLLAALK